MSSLLQADHSDILVIGSCNSVPGVATDSKRYFALLRSQSTLINLYELIQTVDRDVSFEVPYGTGVWLKCPRSCSANARSEHCISAHIGSNVQKQIAFPKKVKRKHHVGKLVQSNVDVPGRPNHTVSEGESLPSNPVEKNLALKSAA